jgi:hypothetical protein
MKPPVLIAALFLFSFDAAVLAAEPAAGMPGVTPPPAVNPVEYKPSMGDLMTMAVQPRHIKLGLAGQKQNWAYASFEISELRNAFARIARTIPNYQSMDTASMVAAMIGDQINALGDAIKVGDAGQFRARYAQLTQACNACHQAQNHAMVVIKVPDDNVYPDQEFRPSRK